jgi:hypothetical protein
MSEKKYWPKASNKPRPSGLRPDHSKCSDQKSRELNGSIPADRGMCEKQSTTEGSE